MSAASDAIREFHEAFDVERAPRGSSPEKIKRVAKAREKLHDEEHRELGEVLDKMIRFGNPAGGHLAEELADVIVIAYGTADVLGIDLDRAFAIKMAANMAKLPECQRCDGRPRSRDRGELCPACHGTGKGPPIKRADGKVLKPPGWQKPSMAEAIK